MKKHYIMIGFLITICTVKLTAQSFEVQQILLDVEKLNQLKKILDNMYQGYQVVSKGYNTINDISQGNFNLHQAFLDGLLQVSPVVRKYKKIADVFSSQTQLVKEYKAAMNRFTASGMFNPDELKYIGNVYQNLLAKSLQHLNELALVITAGSLRMSDDERLKAIDRISKGMKDKLNFLQVFNKENSVLVLQRAKASREVMSSRQLNGL
jgi:DNA repair ATPase RecN